MTSKKVWANKRIREALEHSNIINQDGVLLDEDLNLQLDEEGTEYIIPEKYWKVFRRWDENEMEWIKWQAKINLSNMVLKLY